MIRIFSGMSCFYVGVTAGLTNNDVLINFSIFKPVFHTDTNFYNIFLQH